jgi:hypothetical protein
LIISVNAKVDLQMLSYKTLPRCVDKVRSFTPKYKTTEQLPSVTGESGTYYAFLLVGLPAGTQLEGGLMGGRDEH